MGSFRCSVTVIRTVVQVCAAWADRAQLRMQLQFSQCLEFQQEPVGASRSLELILCLSEDVILRSPVI